MGYGRCQHKMTKTKVYEEKGKSPVTKTVTTHCECNKFYTTIPKPKTRMTEHGMDRFGNWLTRENDHDIGTVCNACGHVWAYHQ